MVSAIRSIESIISLIPATSKDLTVLVVEGRFIEGYDKMFFEIIGDFSVLSSCYLSFDFSHSVSWCPEAFVLETANCHPTCLKSQMKVLSKLALVKLFYSYYSV
jgi:hypothetical protein